HLVFLFSLLPSAISTHQAPLAIIPPAAPHLVNLRQIPGDDLNPRPDAVTIALHADEPDHNEIVRVTAVVSQQLGRAVKVVDYQVDVAVIIQIREGDSSTRSLLRQRRSELPGDFRKSPVAVVTAQQLALAIILQLWVNVPIGDEQIAPAVVVVIEEFGTPAYVRQANAGDVRLIRNVREHISPVVMVERVVLVYE